MTDVCLPIHRLERQSRHQLTVSKAKLVTQFIRSEANASDINLALYLYTYTSGRWLNHDKLERDSRYIQFDFAALCTKAVELCPGAGKVIRYEKKEGGFNRSFVIIMNNGTRIVARLPTCIAGPRQLTTNSEVATMTYTKFEFPRRLRVHCSCWSLFAITSKVAYHSPRA